MKCKHGVLWRSRLTLLKDLCTTYGQCIFCIRDETARQDIGYSVDIWLQLQIKEMAIGCRAQQLAVNKCFGKCTIRSADYPKRVRSFYSFHSYANKNNEKLRESYYQNLRTLYVTKNLAATPRLSPQEVKLLSWYFSFCVSCTRIVHMKFYLTGNHYTSR